MGALGIFLGMLESFGKVDRCEHPGDDDCAVLPTAHRILRVPLPGSLRNAARDGAHPQTIGAVVSSRRTDAVDSPGSGEKVTNSSPARKVPARRGWFASDGRVFG